jgi:hypothetical protein
MRSRTSCSRAGKRIGAAAAFLVITLGAEALLADPPPGEGPRIEFFLPRTASAPGEVLEVPVLLRTEAPLSLVGFTIEFDPAVLEVLEIKLGPRLEAIVTRPGRVPGEDWGFEAFSNEAEGWIQGVCVADYAAREEFAVPPGELLEVSSLVLRVKEDAPEGQTALTFTRGGSARFRGEFSDGEHPVYNAARRPGRPFPPEERFRDLLDPDLEDGSVTVSIIGDIGIFVRGDANVDENIDISDSLCILGALFLGEEKLSCEDAADANDDGDLDISDPVTILDYLFTGLSTVPLHGLRVVDETPDTLDCRSAP